MSNYSSLIDQLSTTQAQKEVKINALFDAASPGMLWGRHDATTSGLTWGFYGGWYNGQQVSNGTVTLTNAVTNYVYADPISGAVSVNTTGFPAASIPLYTVVTAGSVVTGYTDERDHVGPVDGMYTVAGLTNANVTLTAPQGGARILKATGTLTGNVNIVVPLNVHMWVLDNSTTGAFTLTFIGATGSGVVVGSGKHCIAYADGTNVNRVTADA